MAERFRQYFSYNYISDKKRGKSIISHSLLKYGYASFSVEILEYCDRSEVLSREQYYLDLLKPEYNILQIAGSPVGYKHSEESLEKMRIRSNSQEHKEHLKKLHAETRTKRLEHLKSHNASEEQRSKSRERLLEYNKSLAHKVEILDTKNNETTSYYSIREAARAIGCSHSLIINALKKLKEKGVNGLIKGRYIVKIV